MKLITLLALPIVGALGYIFFVKHQQYRERRALIERVKSRRRSIDIVGTTKLIDLTNGRRDRKEDYTFTFKR